MLVTPFERNIDAIMISKAPIFFPSFFKALLIFDANLQDSFDNSNEYISLKNSS